jgi:hypothetical protein
MARRAPQTGLLFGICLTVAALLLPGAAFAAKEDSREQVALSIAEMLRSARAVISANQPLINDPAVGDKGLTGALVLAKAKEKYVEVAKRDPASIDPKSVHGHLMKALMDSIVETMNANQELINQKGVEFKAFIPALFARLVSERFRGKVGADALINVTAPNQLVRNRSARPDPWELQMIDSVLLDPTHPKGKHIATAAEKRGRGAFRVLIPEYYAESCLNCHGGPKGEPDITGYPKEGGSVGQLGGVISVTIFDRPGRTVQSPARPARTPQAAQARPTVSQKPQPQKASPQKPTADGEQN